MTKKILYFAYGSNMNVDQMRWRCPDSEPLCAYELAGWRLVFRGVADIEPDINSTVQGCIWEITEACEAELDRYEGFPALYRKEYLSTEHGEVMVYVMNREGYQTPWNDYYESIAQGFRDFGWDDAPLVNAVLHAANAEEKWKPRQITKPEPTPKRKRRPRKRFTLFPTRCKEAF